MAEIGVVNVQSALRALCQHDHSKIVSCLRKLHKDASQKECLLNNKEFRAALLEILYIKSKSRWHEKLLCMKVLQQCLPLEAGEIQVKNLPWDESQVPFLLPPILNQFICDENLSHLALAEIIRWLSTQGIELQVQTSCLMALNCVLNQHINLLNDDHINIVDSQFCEWLKRAELQQAPSPYSRGLFKKDKKQMPPVTEVDGTITKDFFTALCVGQYYTNKQLLNIHSFSMLRRWLFQTRNLRDKSKNMSNVQFVSKSYTETSFPSPTDTKIFSQSPRHSLTSSSFRHSPSIDSEQSPSLGSNDSENGSGCATPTSPGTTASSHMDESILWGTPRRNSISWKGFDSSSINRNSSSPSGRSSPSGWSLASDRTNVSSIWGSSEQYSGSNTGSLSEAAYHYSMKIFKQARRNAKVAYDQDIQKAALIEAIGIFDHLYAAEPNLRPKILEAIKTLCGIVNAKRPQIIIPLLQFLINHGDSLELDAASMYQMYFDKVVSMYYMNYAVAMDTVLFINDNLETLCYETSVLFQYFPNLFKLLAWDPVTHLEIFKRILPAVMSPTTAIEVLHSLLDLPCLAATLEVEQLRTKVNSDSSKIIDNVMDPKNKPLFLYISRSESGHGDTIDRLKNVHEILKPLSNFPRVTMCSKIVPSLLELYFGELEKNGDETFANKIVPVLLERCHLLIEIPGYKDSISRLFSNQLVGHLQRSPSVILDEFSMLLEYSSSLQNIISREEFFTHLIYGIGEFLSPVYNEQCTPDIISTMYEGLEVLSYEVTASVTRKENIFHPRLLTVLMSTIAKLSSRCQDLIPRAILCLTKLGQCQCSEESALALTRRATQLINVLKMPNVAAVILSPAPEINDGRWHRDCSSLSVLLHTTAELSV